MSDKDKSLEANKPFEAIFDNLPQVKTEDKGAADAKAPTEPIAPEPIAAEAPVGKVVAKPVEDPLITVRTLQPWFYLCLREAGSVFKVKRSCATDSKGELLEFLQEVEPGTPSQLIQKGLKGNPYGQPPIRRG